MAPNIDTLMCEVFSNVQFSKRLHQKYHKRLKSRYEREDLNIFSTSFISCLKIFFTKAENNPNVDNVINFAAKFAISFINDQAPQEEVQTNPFLFQIFDFLLLHHNSRKTAIRFHICQFLNLMLNSLGPNAVLEDDLCNKITTAMVERMLDSAGTVRAQAVLTMMRLQNPDVEHCPVLTVYLFHLNKDPYAGVRKAILLSIAVHKKVLTAVLERIMDINEGVRKLAYQFMHKIAVKSLSIKQRVDLLKSGLTDRSRIVQDYIKNHLLPLWLQDYKGDYKTLLIALDVETATKTAILAINALTKGASVAELKEQLPINSETKLIPFEQLTNGAVVYWRCLVEHLHRETCTEQVAECLPELSKFCDYTRQFLAKMNPKEDDLFTKQFILLQLFEIVKTYDLSDEFGRSNLRNLMFDTLTNENCSEEAIKCIVRHYEVVDPDVDTRLNYLRDAIDHIRSPPTVDALVPIIPLPVPVPKPNQQKTKLEIARLRVQLNELEEEEYEATKKRDFRAAQAIKEQIEALKNEIEKSSAPEISTETNIVRMDVDNSSYNEEKDDSDTIAKCLLIMCTMSGAKSVKKLTPTLRTLFDVIVLPSIDNESIRVHLLALEAMAICSILDEELAKTYIMTFFLQFFSDEESPKVWIISLKAIFDALVTHGFECFGFDSYDGSESTQNGTTLGSEEEENSAGNRNFIKIILGLLDNADQELRTIATEGLCKLLLYRRISGAGLISRLIILMHNPMTGEDAYLRDVLCHFFKTYPVIVPNGHDIMGQALLPTLRTISNAPDASPLQAIELHHISEFVLGITSSRFHIPGSESYDVHNHLALEILSEALDTYSVIDEMSLLKSLKYLDVRFEDSTLRDDVREAVDKILTTVESDKLLEYIQQFRKKIDNVPEVVEPQDSQNNLPVNENVHEI